jgi:hypothetical protein
MAANNMIFELNDQNQMTKWTGLWDSGSDAMNSCIVKAQKAMSSDL